MKIKKAPPARIAAEVTRVATLLGIEKLLPRKPKELSGGERQRVALARAIIRKPRLFLMDEPLSNLDAKLRVQMRAELKRLHQELNITTIYVTHDQEEAMGLSERIAVVYKGKIQQFGIPEEVYTEAKTMFVAGFIGSPPMNFIPTTVIQKAPLVVAVNGVRFAPQVSHPPGGDKVILGIRPQEVAISATQKSHTAIVVLVEFSGAGYWVVLDWQGIKLMGFTQQAENISRGKAIFFRLPTEKCHFFDAQSGQRL